MTKIFVSCLIMIFSLGCHPGICVVGLEQGKTYRVSVTAARKDLGVQSTCGELEDIRVGSSFGVTVIGRWGKDMRRTLCSHDYGGVSDLPGVRFLEQSNFDSSRNGSTVLTAGHQVAVSSECRGVWRLEFQAPDPATVRAQHPKPTMLMMGRGFTPSDVGPCLRPGSTLGAKRPSCVDSFDVVFGEAGFVSDAGSPASEVGQ
jgi:hypothetical protein